MNEEEIQKVYETIEDTLQDIIRNEAYINKKSYFGLNGDLLQYIRNLEQALDEIEKYIQKHKIKHYKLIDEPNGTDIILLENEIDNLLQIIKKAKGE